MKHFTSQSHILIFLSLYVYSLEMCRLFQSFCDFALKYFSNLRPCFVQLPFKKYIYFLTSTLRTQSDPVWPLQPRQWSCSVAKEGEGGNLSCQQQAVNHCSATVNFYLHRKSIWKKSANALLNFVLKGQEKVGYLLWAVSFKQPSAHSAEMPQLDRLW